MGHARHTPADPVCRHRGAHPHARQPGGRLHRLERPARHRSARRAGRLGPAAARGGQLERACPPALRPEYPGRGGEGGARIRRHAGARGDGPRGGVQAPPVGHTGRGSAGRRPCAAAVGDGRHHLRPGDRRGPGGGKPPVRPLHRPARQRQGRRGRHGNQPRRARPVRRECRPANASPGRAGALGLLCRPRRGAGHAVCRVGSAAPRHGGQARLCHIHATRLPPHAPGGLRPGRGGALPRRGGDPRRAAGRPPAGGPPPGARLGPPALLGRGADRPGRQSQARRRPRCPGRAGAGHVR